MSTTAVLPLFRTRLNGLGYREWTEAFNIENNPSTILDKSYHLEINDSTSVVINQHVLTITMPLTVRIFRKGFRDNSAMRDEMLAEMESFVCDILLPNVRFGSAVKNIVFNGFSLLPLDESNDTSVVLEMSFSTQVMLDGFN